MYKFVLSLVAFSSHPFNPLPESVYSSPTETHTHNFIRLADALCGFLRDALTEREEFRRVMEKAVREGYLTQLEGDR